MRPSVLNAPFSLALVAACVSLASGCSGPNDRLMQSPLNHSQQEQELLEIAPVGTPRDEAIKKLESAGIEGRFGSTDTLYYCDIWNRTNGQRWLIDVALLFDEDGNLYEVRRGTTQITTAAGAVADPSRTDTDQRPASRPPTTGAAGKTDRRLPFVGTESLE